MVSNQKYNLSPRGFFKSFLLVFLGALLFSLSACLKEDKMVKKPTTATVITTIDNIKKHQFYYSLKDSAVVSSNGITDWDLRFDADEHFNIWLNSSRLMYVADAGAISLDEISLKDGLTFKFDFPSGARDSNAIHNWGDFSLSNPLSLKHTYVLYRGQNENGDSLGFIKFQILDFNANSYTIQFKDLSDVSALPHTLVIPKQSEYNYTYVSLNDKGSVVNIEPKKTDWDLWFTFYTARVYNFADGLYYPYQVGGCLINPYQTTVAFDTTDRFQDMAIVEAAGLTYHHNWDIIGYGWKSFSGIGSGSGEYTIFTYVTYIIKTQREEYYKIRFLDYYNAARQSGYPKFEQMQL